MEWLMTLAPMSLPRTIARRGRGAHGTSEATGRRGAVEPGTAEIADEVLVQRIGAGDRLSLAVADGDQYQMASIQDRGDSLGEHVAGDLVEGAEETVVVAAGLLIELNYAGRRIER